MGSYPSLQSPLLSYFGHYLWVVLDGASPHQRVLEILHQSPMNLVDETLDRSVVPPQNHRLIIIRQLSLWFRVNSRKVQILPQCLQ